jgi:hypothetical protein
MRNEVKQSVERQVKQCGYCFCMSHVLKKINLRLDAKRFEKRDIDACTKCIEYLKGKFKYV